jgi:ribosomal protein S18 acetylase RimI-like enzyme
MVADEALGDVQPLVDADWVCIGQTAFMGLELDPSAEVPDDPNIRRLEPSELDAARALTEVTFGLDPKDALVAMPPDAASRPGQVVWGVFSDDGELACTTMGAWVEDTITYWGIATAPAFRRQGYASRLTGFMFPHDAQLGMRYVVAHTTPYGEALTKALGFEVLERWQMWSRPRWVLGRS